MIKVKILKLNFIFEEKFLVKVSIIFKINEIWKFDVVNIWVKFICINWFCSW